MSNVDMSAKAVTARLRQISQLRRLALSLRKAKLRPATDRTERAEPPSETKRKGK